MWIPVLVLLITSYYCHGESYETINTRNEYKYIPSKYDFSRHRYVKFEVKTCNDAHINLMADVNQDVDNTYEIVIGGWGNTKSVIRKKKQERPPRAERRGRYLKCDEFKTFWISWDFWNTIRVGTPDSTLMYYSDKTPYKITGISVSTGWGASGMWKIYNPDFTPRTCCQTHPTHGGNELCIVPGLDCHFYTQQDISYNPNGLTYLQICARNTRLDTTLCTCNHNAVTICNV